VKRTQRMRKWHKLAFACAVLMILAAVLAAYLIHAFAPPPRLLAPYLVKRATQHNPVIVGTGNLMSRILLSLDRGTQQTVDFSSVRVGAQHTAKAGKPVTQGGRTVHVSSSDEVLKAIAQADSGDRIVLAPGNYRFQGKSINVLKAGTREQRITLSAEVPNTAILELNTLEGFLVAAPYWTFENLTLRGVCKDHGNCEHAFHVVGGAHHFVARNNTIVDFNAHFKINRIGAQFPDEGLIEGNTLTNTSVRNTASSVTPVDLVAASGWTIRRNLITDFIKGHSDQTSYGAFAKGAGAENRFEQNIVICENQLRGTPGRRVGLSLGGGGTKDTFCRDGRCIVEQDRGVIEANLIASCSDDGIYINRGASSKVVHNTLIDTGGMTVRFPESSAEVEGNLVDARIRSREEGIVRKNDNIETSMAKIYAGMHPVRDLFVVSAGGKLTWDGEPPRRSVASTRPLDLCGGQRPSTPVYGAFENFQDCLSPNGADPIARKF